MRAIGLTPGFSGRYGCNRPVFSERYERMDEAIAREKQIKGGSRARKWRSSRR
jgi:predicted GIY-YIG superfamily endonuclease